MVESAPALALHSLLIIGGARSGKSRSGQRLAEASGRAPVLVATAEPGDAEMQARITRHRGERDHRWRVVEEPIALVEALRREAAADRTLVVDCLTLWLANLMLGGLDCAAETERLAALAATLAGPAIYISNEVGAGIVPDNALARAFLDAQGCLNQAMAAACDSVVLVTAGLSQVLKPSSQPLVQL